MSTCPGCGGVVGVYCWNPQECERGHLEGCSHPDAVLATRVTDGMGRVWALHPDGSWRALGHALSADSLADVLANYGPAEAVQG